MLERLEQRRKRAEEKKDIPKAAKSPNRMFRKFTVQCIEEAEFIMLSLDMLVELEIQFPEVYEDIFNDQEYMLWSTL